MIRTLSFAAAAALALVAAIPAQAEEPFGPRIIRLFIVDRDADKPKTVHYHDRRYYVAGEEGKRYALRIQNISNERAMAVLSVDGVNVISGETASHQDRGYILEPGQVADITGWRKNQDEVAVFRFAPLPKSYAAQTGRPGNVGVIGMAVFRERKPPPPPVSPPPPPKPIPAPPIPMPRPAPEQRMEAADAMPAPPPPPPAPPPPPSPVPPPVLELPSPARVAMPDPMPVAKPVESSKLGTAHGEIEASHSPVMPFERLTREPESLRIVEYDSLANLVAAGVIPAPQPSRRKPKAFPADHAEPGYVPDPPGGG